MLPFLQAKYVRYLIVHVCEEESFADVARYLPRRPVLDHPVVATKALVLLLKLMQMVCTALPPVRLHLLTKHKPC